MKKKIATLLAVLFVVISYAQTSRIVSGNTSFSIGSIAGNVHGTFDAPTGEVVLNPADLSKSKMKISIGAASVFTDHKRRDADAKREKYLSAE